MRTRSSVIHLTTCTRTIRIIFVFAALYLKRTKYCTNRFIWDHCKPPIAHWISSWHPFLVATIFWLKYYFINVKGRSIRRCKSEFHLRVNLPFKLILYYLLVVLRKLMSLRLIDNVDTEWHPGPRVSYNKIYCFLKWVTKIFTCIFHTWVSQWLVIAWGSNYLNFCDL